MTERNFAGCVVLNRALPEISGDSRQLWVQLAPADGEVEALNLQGETIRQRFSPESNRRVALNFTPEGLVDFEHRSLLADDTTAGAWIKQLDARADGTLWGLWDFTDVGWDAVRNKRIRHQSPVFTLDPDGFPKGLVNVALTNKHNLKTLSPILNKNNGRAGASNPDNPEKGGRLKDIAIALGLPADAESAVVLNKVKEVAGSVVTLQATVTELQGKLTEMQQTALNKEADEFIAAHTAVIADPAAFKAQYVLNKSGAIALVKAIKLPEPARREFRQADTREPDAARTTLNKVAEQGKLVGEIRRRDGVGAVRAWEIARQEKPELFA